MAKLSSASIRLVQKLNRQMSDGSYPIYIVVCFGGRMEKSTGVSCLPKFWDSKREEVKKSCPNAPILNKMLNDIKTKVISKKNEYEYNGRVYTPAILLGNCKVDFSAKSNIYKSIMDSLIDERRLKYKTVERYNYAYTKLCDYIGRKDFIIDELNVGLVKDFLNSINISDGSKKTICSCIASVWNYAVDKKIVDGSDYPFKEFKFASKLNYGERDYFLDYSHLKKLKEYWLDLCIERDGELWSYKEGVEGRLMKRYTKEFGILWFLLMYRLNGSAPSDVALLRTDNCSRVVIDGDDYWAIDFKRIKTNTNVMVRWKRDMFCIIALEHFLGRSRNGYIYPIVSYNAKNDKEVLKSIHKASEWAIKAVREAFSEINEATIRNNVEKGLNEPLVDVGRVVMYTARHSLANHLLSNPNVSIRELASVMSRSANTIDVYIHQLTKNEEIASVSRSMPI